MPAVNRVPPKKQALAGPMRILVEGSQGAWFVSSYLSLLGLKNLNVCVGPVTICLTVPNSTVVHPRRSVPLMHSFVCLYFQFHIDAALINSSTAAGSRYVDVSAGGPDSFTWTAISNVSWLTAVPSSGSISASNPEKRVELKVKWSGIPAGQTGYGQVTFTANPSNPDQPELSPATQEVVPVYVPAVHTTVPSGWHGEIQPLLRSLIW
jgi:hypothetical protein